VDRRALLLTVAVLATGCPSPPDPDPARGDALQPPPPPAAADDGGERPTPRPGEAEPAPGDAAGDRAARPPRQLLALLLPLERGRVLWYAAEWPDGARLPAAFFTADGPRAGVYLQSLGLEPGTGEGLRLWRSERAIWLVGGAFLQSAAYRVWVDAPRWGEGRSARRGYEQIETPAGEFNALRLDRRGPEGVEVRHWLAPGTGLVRLDVRRGEARVLRLELVETVARGRPEGGYDRGAPEALWESVGRALRRLDVGSLELLLSPGLRARERRSPWDAVSDLQPPAQLRWTPSDPRADRIRREIAELLALDVTLAGPFVVEAGGAAAPAELTNAAGRRVPCVVALRRLASGAWRWDELRVE